MIFEHPFGPVFDGLIGQSRSYQTAFDCVMREQASASLNVYNTLLNYRPTVFVSQGWRDWYAIGDQLQ